MGKIDQLTNEYMSDKARFADVFNYFVYDGRQVLIPATGQGRIFSQTLIYQNC